MANALEAVTSFDKFDEMNSPRPQSSEFEKLSGLRISRRAFLGVGLGLSGFVMGTGGAVSSRAEASPTRLDFQAVKANTFDTVTLPDGYRWDRVMSWGDELWSSSVPFDQTTRGTESSQLLAVGDNNDGMSLLLTEGRSILVANNEYCNGGVIFGNRVNGKAKTVDDIRKGMAAHGVTICEVGLVNGKWAIIKDSEFNRRITPQTPMLITGPAKGHNLLKTRSDPAGTQCLGTWNNCGNGQTPWGTYLTCEENFNGYFSSSDYGYKATPDQKRYGIGKRDWGYGWARVDDRFDVSKNPNESNRNGYVVEIDPLDPKSTPKKRTALGRLKHENAQLVMAKNGQAVVYMGDDERGEFLYRFISNGKYIEGGNNDDLLEDGDLFVARFADDGSGEWIKLTPETTGMPDKATICIHTRQAASAVAATTMDRPEWIASNPNRAELYCALTNNKKRGKGKNKGGDKMRVGGPNPRAGNRYGQILRWRPTGQDHTATTFDWDLFVVAGNPVVHAEALAGSGNITRQNMFNSPDGIAFDTRGLLWIQTDGKTSDEGDFAGMGNNQMLLADPETGEIKRFMVGPKECEITGICWSDDRKTVFVGIQHPGDRGGGHFPDGGDTVPRSSIIAIQKEDGGVIG